MKKKIKLLTQNDLDGVGCYIVAKILLAHQHHYGVDVTYCTHSNIQEMMSETILKGDDYEHIYMTDIVVYDDYIQQFFTPEVVEKTTIIDHHKSALDLNKYDFAHICIQRDDKLMSGTYLFYQYLKKTYEFKLQLDIFNKLERFVEAVRSYDTWDWSKYNNLLAKDINDLLYIKGIKNFAEDMIEILLDTSDNLLLRETDCVLLTSERHRISNYIKAKEKDIFELQLYEYHLGVIFAEQYVSELGNQIALNYPEYDAIAIIGSRTVSLRTVKEDIDVSVLAKRFNGGGHKKAAGFPLTADVVSDYINIIFRKKRLRNELL